MKTNKFETNNCVGLIESEQEFPEIISYIERNEEYIKSVATFINRIRSSADLLGEGAVAQVITSHEGDYGDICVKVLKDLQYLPDNDAIREGDIHYEAMRVGVSVPEIVCSTGYEYDRDDFGRVVRSYIVMKTVHGHSLEEIAKKEFELPKDFKVDVFIDKLKNEVERMHQAGIYHRDLHLGNVMIDEEGNPVIIDFGRATKNAYGNPYELEKADGTVIDYLDDDNQIEICKKELENITKE